jgi:hypothetical protein
MTKRERVETALRLQETDRIPVYDLLYNDEAIRHFTGKNPPVGKEGLRLKARAIGAMLDMTRALGESENEDGFVRYRIDKWRSGGIRERPFHDEHGAKLWLGKAIHRRRYSSARRPDGDRPR